MLALPPRFSLPLTTTLLLLLTLTISTFPHLPSLSALFPNPQTSPHLHLLLPATTLNPNLCKLLLTTSLLHYPTPVLLGWAGHGAYNGTTSHLFKIASTLEYLKRLGKGADAKGDLVLLLDAHDVWVQLGPGVVVERYWRAVARGEERFGARSRVLFGPDKVCWPEDERRAACWAAPEAGLGSAAFGPGTDGVEMGVRGLRPRWLNSGTIMGPARDMRELFARTMEVVRGRFDEGYPLRNSDQFYFQEVWAEQEIGRRMLREGRVEAPLLGNGERGVVPEIQEGQRTEYGIALDYESDVFQTATAYTGYLTWMSFNHSTPCVEQQGFRRMDQVVLSPEILRSKPPFSGAGRNDDLPRSKGWKDVMLGTNMITQQPFPIYHITGEKSYRERWWPRMWFHPHAEALLKMAKREAEKRGVRSRVVAKADGISYFGADSLIGNWNLPKGLGAWTDQGEFLKWDDLCGEYEDELFLRGKWEDG